MTTDTQKPVTHQPKGGMCSTCVHLVLRNCSHLPFESMPVIEVSDNVKIVRCTDHQRMPPRILNPPKL